MFEPKLHTYSAQTLFRLDLLCTTLGELLAINGGAISTTICIKTFVVIIYCEAVSAGRLLSVCSGASKFKFKLAAGAEEAQAGLKASSKTGKV